MNDKIKNALSVACNLINKLPFRRLSEKFSDKIPLLKKLAPFANFIVCGLIVGLCIVKFTIWQVRINSYISKEGKIWETQSESYDALDLTNDYKNILNETVVEMNKCTNDKNGLKMTVTIKEKSKKQLDDLWHTFYEKCNDIQKATSIAVAEMEKIEFPLMSKKQFNKYGMKRDIWLSKVKESSENCHVRNDTVYADCVNKLNEVYSERVDKINKAIKEANRKAYIAYVQKTLIGSWSVDTRESSTKEEIKFRSDRTFSYYHHEEAVKSLPKGRERIRANSDGTVTISLLNEKSSPERLQSYSGTYYFEDDVVVLNVKDVSYLNFNSLLVKKGDQLKVKVGFTHDKNDNNLLWFNKKTYRRN